MQDVVSLKHLLNLLSKLKIYKTHCFARQTQTSTRLTEPNQTKPNHNYFKESRISLRPLDFSFHRIEWMKPNSWWCAMRMFTAYSCHSTLCVHIQNNGCIFQHKYTATRLTLSQNDAQLSEVCSGSRVCQRKHETHTTFFSSFEFVTQMAFFSHRLLCAKWNLCFVFYFGCELINLNFWRTISCPN